MTIAIDTETGLSSNAEPNPRLVSVAFANEDGCALLHTKDVSLPAFLAEAFMGRVVFAHAPFDIYVLLRRCPDLFPLIVNAYQEGRVHDVLLREKMIDTAMGTRFGKKYNLGDVAKRRADLQINKDDPWRLRYIELINTPIEEWPDDAVNYARNDGTSTHAVFEQQEVFRARHTADVFLDECNQVRKALALWSQTLQGIHTDQRQVDVVAQRLDESIKQGGQELWRAGLASPKSRSNVALKANLNPAKELMRKHCAETPGAELTMTAPSKTNPRGTVSLDDKAMKKALIPKGHLLDTFATWKGERSLRTQTIPIFRRPLIRTRYDPYKETSRTGSGAPQGKRKPHDVADWEWIGRNLQNLAIKGGFRECLVPPPGKKFLISDWGGAELGTFSQIEIEMFGRSVLGEALAQGLDAHRHLACKLLGIRYDDYDKENPKHKERRQFAKIPNFGFLGGLGAERFVQHAATKGAAVTLEEAKHVKQVWLDTWQTRPYFKWWGDQQAASSSGLITVIDSRSGLIRGGCRFSEACNTPFQRRAASMAGTALWWLWLAQHDKTSPLFQCPQVLFVHDENVTVVSPERADAALAEQERLMIEAARVWCPDVPIGVESSVTDRYCK